MLMVYVLLYIYLPSIYPLHILYYTSTSPLLTVYKMGKGENNYSHLGNEMFPVWE